MNLLLQRDLPRARPNFTIGIIVTTLLHDTRMQAQTGAMNAVFSGTDRTNPARLSFFAFTAALGYTSRVAGWLKQPKTGATGGDHGL